jgi:hypothetical protein
MNYRNDLISFLGEMAARSKDIGHDNTSRETRRYFQWGSSEAALLGNYAIDNTGWNLLIDMMPAGNVDNKHDYEARLFRVALHFVHQVNDQDIAGISSAIDFAYELGWEFLVKAREHIANPCSSNLSNTAGIPATIDFPGIRHQEIAPLIFIGDKLYGYRFEVEFKYDRDIKTKSTPGRWK